MFMFPLGFVVWNRDESEPLFWSNADGWVSLDAATAFSASESGEFNLPIGGAWLTLRVAGDLVYRHRTPGAWEIQ